MNYHGEGSMATVPSGNPQRKGFDYLNFCLIGILLVVGYLIFEERVYILKPNRPSFEQWICH